MFSKTIVAVLFASVAVFAAPVETSNKEVEGRQINQSVTLCSDKGMADCDTVNFNFGFCVSPIGRLNDKVSSLNANGYNCIFYNDTGCRNGGGQIATTGEVTDIRSHPSFSTMNDDVSSFLCNI
ncbi:hypothetical protein CPAR01_11968 [Colletotrichum paranaense]|uniref:Ecp1(P1) n=8 Tax=Colletotrichum acutatum species complex TaxID=2707335 RepID=A0A9Q0B5U3_9PEZI|nr:uncharacterized protein CLUP02_09785 [Colletotrichum lupini]XP_060312799.1 uncharacterized protein CCOS01_08364 [Colletotrichum costaricense]XP_060345011.1 uncharacterized protein CPAR01_11968 [Colletotrichum paranaense]XP_060401458.1 uncharacterized protein CABS01_01000 [Colletotrichum abscissum]KAI3542587.1 hypothetical protein CSPX01_06792 [Colletotrichum filicis]KAK0369816.1 hypothetical protein CLIM01_12823 [Colletotrichum limetticola]KAK1469766.1 hypothetical protein CMEL01_01533 [Co